MATIYLKLVANYRVVEDPEDDPEDPSESVKLQFQKKGASEAELIMLVQGEPLLGPAPTDREGNPEQPKPERFNIFIAFYP